MKGIGSYSAAVLTERKPGMLILYTGDRASVRFHDGQVYAIPAAPLRAHNIVPGGRFMLVVRRQGPTILDVHVELLADPRPPRERQATPKVYVRQGRRGQKLVTRRGQPRRVP